jgi:hypothetical protein
LSATSTQAIRNAGKWSGEMVDVAWVADVYAKEIEFATKWARSLPLWSELPVTLPNELKLST